MLASPVTLFVNPFPSGLLYVSGHDYKSFYNLLTQLSYQRSYRSAFYTLYYQNSSHCWLFGSKPQIKNPFGCRSVRRITASGYRFVIFQLQNDNLATGIITLPNKHFPKKWLLLKSEPATENNLPSSAWQLHPSSGVWFIVLFTRGHVWVSATHWFTQNDSTHSLQDPSYPRTCEASSSLFLLVFSCCADLYFDGWSVFPVASFTYFLRCFPVVSVPRDSNCQLSCHMKRFSDWYTFAVGIIHRCVCNSDSSAFCRSSCSFKARGEKREAACLNLGVGVVTSLTAALNLSKEV